MHAIESTTPSPTSSSIPLPKISDIQWNFFKAGSFNYTFLGSLNHHWWILKKPKNNNILDAEMNNPKRFIRKNALINQNKLPVSLQIGYDVCLSIPPAELEETSIYLFKKPDSKHVIIKYFNKDSQWIEKKISNINVIPAPLRASIIDAVNKNHMPLVLKNELLDQLHLTRDMLIMPFIGRHIPTDVEREAYVLKIYRETRNIIVDACIPGNILEYEGEIICVDFDWALDRTSELSIKYLEELQRTHQPIQFLKKNITKHCNPRTAEMCLNLLYLEKYLSPESLNNEYLIKEIMLVIQHFRNMNVIFRPEYLAKIKLLTEHVSNVEHHLSSITPYFLSQISAENPQIHQHIHRLLNIQKSECIFRNPRQFSLFHRNESLRTFNHPKNGGSYSHG